MIEYELLKIIWWVLVGVLLIGFALTDGFDMGAMAIMPFVAKTDQERRVAINTIAPPLGWQPSLVYYRWRRAVCRLADGVFRGFFGHVLGAAVGAICLIFTSRWF